MAKLKIVFVLFFAAFLCINSAAEENKNDIMDDFFSSLKKMLSMDIPVMENMEAAVNSELTFSDSTFKALKPVAGELFKTELPKTLKGRGFMRMQFENAGEKDKTERLYLYTDSEIGSLILTKTGNDIELFLPAPGVIIEDRFDEIKKILKGYVGIPETPDSFPADILRFILNFAVKNEGLLREKIRIDDRTISVNGEKTRLFTYPARSGTLDMQMYESSQTFASIGFSSGNKHISLQYPLPENKTGHSHFFPEKVILSAKSGGNTLSVTLSDLKYNRLFSDNDFKIERLNFHEFITVMYLKFLTKQK